MMDFEKLSNLFSESKLNLYEISITSTLMESGSIYLKSESVEDLITFMKDNKINSAFYEYYYYGEDYFTINECDLTELDDEIADIISDDISSYNKKNMGIDVSKPFGLTVFCCYESQKVVIDINDYWNEDVGILTPQELLESLLKKYSIKIDEIKESRDKKQILLEKEFRETVYKDEHFQNSTNNRLRRNYLYKLFKSDIRIEFKETFFDMNGIPTSKCFNMIEEIWRQYKAEKKAHKE